MIEIVEGFWVNPESVTVVKAAGKDKCVLYVSGQSALDGFVLDYPAEEVAEHLTDSLMDTGEEENEEDETDE